MKYAFEIMSFIMIEAENKDVAFKKARRIKEDMGVPFMRFTEMIDDDGNIVEADVAEDI